VHGERSRRDRRQRLLRVITQKPGEAAHTLGAMVTPRTRRALPGEGTLPLTVSRPGRGGLHDLDDPARSGLASPRKWAVS
jgi:hypothetical protein